MKKVYRYWNAARVQQTLGLPVEAQNIQSLAQSNPTAQQTAGGYFPAANDEEARQIVETMSAQTGVDLTWARVPQRLYIAAYPDSCSGFSEALETGKVFDIFNNTKTPALVFSFEELSDKPLMRMVESAMTLAERTVGNGTTLEAVIIDADEPDRVFAFLHDYTQ